jgi:hypothetical protein
MQGALRKWWFPSLGTPLYLAQYVLIFTFYILVPKKLNQPKIIPAFSSLLAIYVGYGFLEIFNLGGTSNMIVQIYGFIMHFGFVPLVYYMAKVLMDEESFSKCLVWFSFAMMGLFFLGFIQYFSPQGSFINRYALDAEEGTYEVVIGDGGRARITSTFSYIATYASFLCFIMHLLFYGILLSLLNKKLSWYFAVAYGMGIINMFMTGSRGGTIYYGATEVITIIFLVMSGQVRFLTKLIPLVGLLFVGYFIILATEVGATAFQDFVLRLFGHGDIATRLGDSFDPFKFNDLTGFAGFGIGTAQYPMSPFLTNRWEMPAYFEEEGERIVIELGAIGYFIVMALRIAVFISCFAIYKRIKKLEYKILALQMSIYQLPFMINLQTNIFNYVDGLFYWMAIGLVYFAQIMDKQEIAKLVAYQKESQNSMLNQPYSAV